MQKAISSLTIKSIDEDLRIIRGIASTPSVDRVGDIIEPLGIRVAKSVPLLHHHSHADPVGTVHFEKPTKSGIAFEARLPKITEPGPLKDRVDTAWGEVKHGLITDVSVGFRPIPGETEALPGGGLRFKAVELFELSLVSVGANPDAKILEVRAARAAKVSAPGARHTPAFISAADRRKARGGTIVDEKRYVRNARRALALRFGEDAVPRFQTLKALESWDDDRQRSAITRGALYLGYEAIVSSAPKAVSRPVVRLNDPAIVRSIR